LDIEFGLNTNSRAHYFVALPELLTFPMKSNQCIHFLFLIETNRFAIDILNSCIWNNEKYTSLAKKIIWKYISEILNIGTSTAGFYLYAHLCQKFVTIPLFPPPIIDKNSLATNNGFRQQTMIQPQGKKVKMRTQTMHQTTANRNKNPPYIQSLFSAFSQITLA